MFSQTHHHETQSNLLNFLSGKPSLPRDRIQGNPPIGKLQNSPQFCQTTFKCHLLDTCLSNPGLTTGAIAGGTPLPPLPPLPPLLAVLPVPVVSITRFLWSTLVAPPRIFGRNRVSLPESCYL